MASKQTSIMLQCGNPYLAAEFEKADIGYGWRIVRSYAPTIAAIAANNIVGLKAAGEDKPNAFSSRTAALRASASIAKGMDPKASEKPEDGGAFGIWRLRGPKGMGYQFCLPTEPKQAASQADVLAASEEEDSASGKPAASAKPADKPADKPAHKA